MPGFTTVSPPPRADISGNRQPRRQPAVLAIARDDGAVRILAGGEKPLSETHLSQPQSFVCAVGAGERCHGFFYTPMDKAEKPPLLVFLHGGPTSACYPVFDPRIAFWTLRGYAVLDLNYRGSSGYGRAYRLRLAGQWGALEVEDIRAAVAKLAGEGGIDPARVFVRGASAGGYSALCALISGGFAGGASLYGVSDPLASKSDAGATATPASSVRGAALAPLASRSLMASRAFSASLSSSDASLRADFASLRVP
jgi:dipeptidyl aminopeptidase/acylaminoacyl peptidase